MLEKIAAINHLAVVDVVRLFLAEGLAKGDRNWELWTFRPPARVDLPTKTRRCQRDLLSFARSSRGVGG
jgi:hypothetical protein